MFVYHHILTNKGICEKKTIFIFSAMLLIPLFMDFSTGNSETGLKKDSVFV